MGDLCRKRSCRTDQDPLDRTIGAWGTNGNERYLLAFLSAMIAGLAHAQLTDGILKVAVLSDMSSLYTDLSGAGSVIAARMAVDDSGIQKRGIKVEVLSADPQNKPDVGAAMWRSWYDTDGGDVIVDVPNSGVAL